ncbi:MAG: hypothetical protein I8H74_06090 [Moraxellaceae bacterium]|nr:hypothetical protein [Moraxellaceae bacterium]
MKKVEYTFKEIMFMGMAFIFFSVGCFLFNRYEMILSFLSLGILFVFLGFLKFRFNSDVALVFSLILIPITLVGSACFNWTYVKEKNRQAPVKIKCGVIENIKNHPQNKDKRFEIVNKGEIILFPLYPRDAELVVNGASKIFCVRYSWDKRWSRKPEVYEIYPQSFE